MNGIVLTAMNGLVALFPNSGWLAAARWLRTVAGFIGKQLLGHYYYALLPVSALLLPVEEEVGSGSK